MILVGRKRKGQSSGSTTTGIPFGGIACVACLHPLGVGSEIKTYQTSGCWLGVENLSYLWMLDSVESIGLLICRL